MTDKVEQSDSQHNMVLNETWELKADHPKSCFGQPTLVNRVTGEAYAPHDVISPYRSWGYMPAALAVERMADIVKATLNDEQRKLIVKFIWVGFNSTWK